jgi:hypothetical protein
MESEPARDAGAAPKADGRIASRFESAALLAAINGRCAAGAATGFESL